MKSQDRNEDESILKKVSEVSTEGRESVSKVSTQMVTLGLQSDFFFFSCLCLV